MAGIGIASLTTPVYIAEMALPRMRGQLVTINALLVTVGQFTAGMVDGALDELLPDTGWRYMLGLAAVPSLIMFWGFLKLPESPRWLANKGRLVEAAKVMQDYRETDEDAEFEMKEIEDALPQEVLDAINENDGDLSDIPITQPRESLLYHIVSGVQNFVSQVWEMLQEKATRKALFLGCGLMWIQQLSGINTVMVSSESVIGKTVELC